MKVLVCGSRDWTDDALIREWLARCPKGTIVVHGAARGADDLAGEAAAALGFEVRRYPADWSAHGNAAGPIRNQKMLDAERPDVVLAFSWVVEPHDRTAPKSITRGTSDMVVRALEAGIRVTIVPPRKP